MFRSASETDNCLFFLLVTLKILFIIRNFFYFGQYTSHNDLLSVFYVVTSLIEFRILTSFLTSRISCLSPRARKKFPALLKIEQTL